MASRRLTQHPILPVESRETVSFTWQGEPLTAFAGETIAAALFANNLRVFGHHPRDGAPQGIFCANGQCAQCLVLADGRPVKACVEPIRAGMRVEPLDGLPRVPPTPAPSGDLSIPEITVPVLVLGGGPAGLAAAIELGQQGVETLLVDDKHTLGGKLVLQTHRFFGSAEDVYAGTRGIDIATRLAEQISAQETVQVWLDSTALAVYSDQKVGIWRERRRYVLVQPQVLVVATGARERSLAFKGNTLPGVYGAGAFQTLVNRDRIRAAERLFIVGGGNVGLIAGYHALQAGIQVVGLVEALPQCGGYKVHRDKLARLGVPIHTSHTILSANGSESVESVTIAQVDEQFNPLPGTERSFACDTVLVAVGLEPVNEFLHKAREAGITVLAAGDAQEIAEASAAIFGGRIAGREAIHALGRQTDGVPSLWQRAIEILKSRPGRTAPPPPVAPEEGVFPVLHCTQEIPCNPCTTVCPRGLIQLTGEDIRGLPEFAGNDEQETCTGCVQCVAICPGLAITLVDYRQDAERPRVTVPYEMADGTILSGQSVVVVDTEGQPLGRCEVSRVRSVKGRERTALVQVNAPRSIAQQIAGIRFQPPEIVSPLPERVFPIADEVIVCRCERVTAGEIRALIRQGYRDVNEIKAIARAGMGACGGKTCMPIIYRIFREMGVPAAEITQHVERPLFVEVPLITLAGARDEDHDREL